VEEMDLGYKHLKGGLEEHKRRPKTSLMKIMKCDIAVPLTGFLYAPDGPVVHTG